MGEFKFDSTIGSTFIALIVTATYVHSMRINDLLLTATVAAGYLELLSCRRRHTTTVFLRTGPS